MPTALDRAVLEAAALATINHFHGPLLAKIPDAAIQLELIDATLAFARARPWERIGGDEPFSLRFTGVSSPPGFGTLYGLDGGEFGLSLFPTEDDFELFASLDETLDQDEVDELRINALSCSAAFDTSPLSLAVASAWGLAVTPRFLLLRGGRAQPLRADDARVLVAALRAVTALATEGTVGEGRCSFLGKTVTATLELPWLADRPRAPPPAFVALDRELRTAALLFARAHGLERAADDAFLEYAHLFLGPYARQYLASLTNDADRAKTEAWIAAHERGRLVLLELLAGVADQVAALDLLSGEHLAIHEPSLSAALEPHQCYAAWLVREDDAWLLASARAEIIPLPDALRARDAFLARFPVGTRWGHDALIALVELSGQTARPNTGLRNTDDEPFASDRDRYSLTGKGDALFDALANAPDVRRGPGRTLALYRQGNAMHRLWWRTQIARFTFDRGELIVDANSHQRLDAVRARLEKDFPGATRFRERVPMDGDPIDFSRVNAHLDLQPLPDDASAEVLTVLEAVANARLRFGEDLASDDPARRAAAIREVRLLAAAMPNEEDRLPFRRALGVGLWGEWLGPDEPWLGFGAGVELNLALEALVAPIALELEGPRFERFCDAMRLGWAAFSVRRLAVPRAEKVAAALAILTPEGAGSRMQGSLIEPRLPASSPNARRLAEFVPFLVERAELLFPFDRRVVDEIKVEAESHHLDLHIMVDLEPEFDARASEAAPDFVHGVLPLDVWGDFVEDYQPASWWLVPRPWQRELMADWFIATHGSLAGRSFPDACEAMVEIESAALRDELTPVGRTCEALEDLGLAHEESVALISAVDWKGKNAEAALRELVQTAERAAGEVQ
ncbi:MAG: hypothetical protein U0228_25485 [Myxococcaceae bacterium]